MRWWVLLVLAGCPATDDTTLTHPCDPTTETCPVKDCDAFQPVGEWQLCARSDATSYTVIAKFTGADHLALDASEIRLGSAPVDTSSSYDAPSQTFTLHATDLAPGKYSFLFRMKTDAGRDVRPLFVPM